MVKKKKSKKSKGKEDLSSNKPIENLEVPKKEIIKKENKQLFWILLIILVFFAAFMVPYFYIDSKKTFDYGGIDWAIEDYEDLRIYHGRFPVFTEKNQSFNMFLRNDPRTNEVPITGDLSNFKKVTYFSYSKEVNSCRGEFPRVISDLSSFFKLAIGIKEIYSATNNFTYSNETNLPHISCETQENIGAIIFNIGEEQGIKVSEQNPYCYTLTLKDCNDLATVEKFMTSIVSYNSQLSQIDTP